MVLWLNSLRFSTKLIILSLLPTLVTLILAGRILHAKFNDIEQLTTIEQNIEHSLLLDNIAHQHAVERGLTSGFLNSQADNDKEQLEQQRLISDEAWHKYGSFIQNINHTELGTLTQSYQLKLTALISKKKSTRNKVDAVEPSNGAFKYYSELNSILSDMIQVTALQISDPTLSNDFFTYRNLLITKEKAGQIRGKLNGVFKANNLSKNEVSTIRGYITNQNQHLIKASNSASEEFAAEIKAFTQSNDYKMVSNIQNIISSNDDALSTIHSEFKNNWFSIATKAINGLQTITDGMANGLINKVNTKISSTRTALYTGICALGVLIFATYLLTWWLIKNLTTRINTLRDTLHRIFVTGDLTLRSSDNG
ncbi:MAG: hypothetical protein ACI84K_002022, partial [Pseudohongiellaceae bacterium]